MNAVFQVFALWGTTFYKLAMRRKEKGRKVLHFIFFDVLLYERWKKAHLFMGFNGKSNWILAEVNSIKTFKLKCIAHFQLHIFLCLPTFTIKRTKFIDMIDFHTFVLLQRSLYDLYWKWFPFSLNVCDMCIKCALSLNTKLFTHSLNMRTMNVG